MVKKQFVKCRRNHKISLPCNWVKDGLCGEDLKPCKIIGTAKETEA